ncbi:MAG: hypothetical protein ACYTFD_12715 [Planctomycetota bacterium]|jgi:hypothetical protein
MIAATVTVLGILFFGGGGDGFIGQTTKLISRFVEDKQRAEQAEAVLAEMRDEITAFRQRVSEVRQEMVEVDGDYDASPADYRRVFRKLDRVWRATESRLIDLRFDLKRSITREEWTALFGEVDRKMQKKRAKEEKKRGKHKQKHEGG